ncbi:FG-GAP repeat domain-containing protein [Marinibacterium sp. SX1]|uniref:FG-GAP repeat domain-containing protein n=1 Tax=Marinibacterium sp. SX1 TaxID=3388424 RepID=UPI003D17242F
MADTIYTDATATHVPAAPNLHALDVAIFDANGDGINDVVLAVEHGVNRLYLNDGTGRLTYVEGALGRGAYDSEHVLAVDMNADGILDLVFVAEDDFNHQFFLGDGTGGFQDVSDRLPARSEGNGLAIGDVNGDGLPDIVVGNSAERRGSVARNFLWLNDPDAPGTFIDVSQTNLPDHSEGTQDIALADLNGDGHLDMVVANQTPPNRILLNDGTGVFSDATDRMEQPVEMETREVHVFDATGNGHNDIVFFNLTSNNRDWDKDPQTRLLINDGTGHFTDETDSLPQHRFSSWGGKVIDFDDDGALDLIVGAIDVPGFVPQQVRAWRNDATGAFEDVTADVIPAETIGRSWSMDAGDLDGDGVDDLFIGQWGTQARMLLTGDGE